MAQELRKCRSGFRGLALDWWLAAIAKRSEVEGLVLADEAGLLVAASMDRAQAVALAAEARSLAQQPRLRPAGPMLVDRRVMKGDPFYLGVVGDRRLALRGLPEAWAGVKRILAGEDNLENSL